VARRERARLQRQAMRRQAALHACPVKGGAGTRLGGGRGPWHDGRQIKRVVERHQLTVAQDSSLINCLGLGIILWDIRTPAGSPRRQENQPWYLPVRPRNPSRNPFSIIRRYFPRGETRVGKMANITSNIARLLIIHLAGTYGLRAIRTLFLYM
jgi:hypothetical protein